MSLGVVFNLPANEVRFSLNFSAFFFFYRNLSYYLSGYECLEMPDVVGLRLTESLHQQLRDLRLTVKLRLAQPQLGLCLKDKLEIFLKY